MVLRKICSTLVTYFIRSPTSWQHPLLHLAMSFEHGDAVQGPAPSDAVQTITAILPALSEQQLMALMWFAATIAEDVGKVDSSTPSHARLHTQMESIVKESHAILSFCFNRPESWSDPSIKAEAIACYGAWTNYAQPIWPRNPEALQYLRNLIPTALGCIYGEEVDDDALDMFADLLESYTSFFEPQHMELIARIINDYIRPLLEEAIADKDDAEASEAYGRLVAAYGSANIQQVIEEAAEGRGAGIAVKLLLDFLASDGYPGDDLFLTFGTIEFWNTYIEYVNDEVFSADPDEQPPAWQSHAKQVATRVVELLWVKLCMPPADIVKRWRDEEHELFKE